METGREKVQKICDILRKETLEPAKKEAEEIVLKARAEAEVILLKAKQEADKMKKEASLEIEKDRNIFQSSLNQACKQSLDSLKEEIEKKLFQEELSSVLISSMQDPKVITNLIGAVVDALEKEGIDTDLDVMIPRAVSAKDINSLLSARIAGRLRGDGVSLGTMPGGITVRIPKDNIIIDLTDAALKELVSKYVRKDFREILFRKA
jgi:V/A-type H+-transporting ATPase subunit E